MTHKGNVAPSFWLPAFTTALIFFTAATAGATDFSSAAFTVKDPVLFSASYGTSTGYRLISTIGQIAIGTSTANSATSTSAGFLYFPFASTPVVSATPGSAEVALSWTASVGFLGWTAGGYRVGQATVSGGPYSYASVGAVLSSTRTGLSNGTTYYFVIVIEDAFGNAIGTSTQVSGTPVASSLPPPPPSGGGGGGGPIYPQTIVSFSGRAYPLSNVTLLKDGQIALSTVAGPDANFQMSLTNISPASYLFSVYGQDKDGVRSNPITFPITLTSGAATNITGIFLAPTISVDKSEVRRGDNIAIFGQSAVKSDITIVVNSDQEYFVKAESDTNGVYLYNFDTQLLDLGGHTTKSKAAILNEVSPFGRVASFVVGTKNVAALTAACPTRGDLNLDCKVNLVDFSIAAFWYKRTLSLNITKLEKEMLSGDGIINLRDFSIMAYYWTG